MSDQVKALEQEMEEALDLSDPRNKDAKGLPEAPVSVSTSVYYKGFHMMITQRDPSFDLFPLVEKHMRMIEWMLQRDFKPSWNEDTNRAISNKQSVPNRNVGANIAPSAWCSLHGVGMKQFTKNNQSWFSHKEGDNWCNGVEK